MLGVKYKEVLESALGGKTLVWHYASDLTTLWSDSFDASQPILVVWDRTSLGGSDDRNERLLEPHLTPLDWVLSWSIRRAGEGKEIPSIIIVDARADQWAGSWTWTLRRQLLADMPWVTLTAPVVRMDGVSALHKWAIALQTLDCEDSADGIIQYTGVGAGVMANWTPRAVTPPELDALKSLSKLWATSLNQSDKHHDINNIVGAKLLLERAGEEVDSPVIRAFLKKVDWLWGTTACRHSWQPWKNNWPENHLYGKDVIVTLYDDMQSAQWVDFLQQFLDELSFSGGAEDSPEELIEFLTKRAVFDKRDFFQNAHEPGNGNPEIIFLDLRIYGDENRDLFLANTRTLLAKASEIVDCQTLAWSEIKLEGSPIGQKEIAAISEWLDLEAKAGYPCADQALLLLPRLLALALPLTPIILFSSTAQASVRDKLKVYRNIFTGFQKPNPLGDPSSIASAADALSTALDFAMPMLQRKLQLAYAQTVAEKMERERPVTKSSKHIEIYFDESGFQGNDEKNRKGTLFSTAAVVHFDSLEDADSACLDLNKNSLPPRECILYKGTNLDHDSAYSEIERLEYILNSRTRKIDIVSIMCGDPSDSWHNSSNASLSAFADAPLDRAISHNIFFILLCYGEYYYHKPTYFINLATRRVIEKNINRRKLFAKRFAIEDWGKSETYNESAGFPLVRGWLQSWGSFYHQVSENIAGILTKSISSGQPLSQKHLGRSLHYIADWAAGFVAIHGNVSHWRTKTILRPHLGGKFFKNLHYSCEQDGNILPLAETLRLIVSSEKPELAQAVNNLCQVPLVQSAGNQGLPKLWQSKPHEHLWLWAIFPHIAVKASGEDLFCGL